MSRSPSERHRSERRWRRFRPNAEAAREGEAARGSAPCRRRERERGDGLASHDQLATGRKLRILVRRGLERVGWRLAVDTFSRFAPAIVPRFGFRAPDVVEVLERIGREHGFPRTIRVDQGRAFISRDLDLRAYRRNVALDFSRSGTPTDNAFVESLNGKFRAGCLNAHWFMSLDDAIRKCEAWPRDCDEVRPHGSIGNAPPIELADRPVALGPP